MAFQMLRPGFGEEKMTCHAQGRQTIDKPMARHLFLVSRHEARLYEYLLERFRDDGNVEVILDRRRGERRGRTARSGVRSSAIRPAHPPRGRCGASDPIARDPDPPRGRPRSSPLTLAAPRAPSGAKVSTVGSARFWLASAHLLCSAFDQSLRRHTCAIHVTDFKDTRSQSHSSFARRCSSLFQRRPGRNDCGYAKYASDPEGCAPTTYWYWPC